jgi:type I restriction enzyme S subunit
MKKGWQTKQLSDASAINYGYTESASSEPVGPRFLRITDIQDDSVDWDSVPFCKIESADFPKYCLHSGDIVFARTGATTGKSFLVNDPPKAVFASYLIRLRLLDKQLLPKFVSLFFQTAGYWQLIKEGSSGSAQGGFNATKLGALRIPVPPLSEQQRIVGVLDEAFASLATAQAHAAQNLQNARDLFESHLNAIFTQRGKGWVEKTLGEVSQFKNGLNYNKSSGGQTLPVVGVADFQDNDLVPLSELQSATIDGVIADNYAIQPNDILTVRSNGSKHLVGRCMLVGDVDEVVSYSGFIIRIRFDTKTIVPQFLLHFMKSQVTRDILTAGGGGANINNINQEKLSALLVPIPPYKTQVKLAAALDELREETGRLTQIYEQKLAALAALKKSLLHQAFSGEL